MARPEGFEPPLSHLRRMVPNPFGHGRLKYSQTTRRLDLRTIMGFYAGVIHFTDIV